MENDDFWQKHSERYLEMAFNTERRERLFNPDGYGSRTGACGDTVEFFLTLFGNDLRFISYQIDGCLNTNACAASISRLMEGKTLGEAWKMTPENLVAYLETLPEEDLHCAELSMGAFYLALADAQKKKI